MQNTNGKLPLQDIKVIDFSQILAGPFCTMLLADMGADVVKIEKPNGGDDTRRYGPPFIEGESAAFLTLNRNKRSIVLDLKSEQGLSIVRRMLEDADVMIHNFRPGVVDRMGLAYDDVSAINPAIVYCTVSGFGTTGPYSSRAGFDLVAQGMSGLMSINGFPGAPPAKVGVPWQTSTPACSAPTASSPPTSTASRQARAACGRIPHRVRHRLHPLRVRDILRHRRGRGSSWLRAPHDSPLSGVRHAGRLHQYRRRQPEQLGAHVPRNRARRPAR